MTRKRKKARILSHDIGYQYHNGRRVMNVGDIYFMDGNDVEYRPLCDSDEELFKIDLNAKGFRNGNYVLYIYVGDEDIAENGWKVSVKGLSGETLQFRIRKIVRKLHDVKLLPSDEVEGENLQFDGLYIETENDGMRSVSSIDFFSGDGFSIRECTLYEKMDFESHTCRRDIVFEKKDIIGTTAEETIERFDRWSEERRMTITGTDGNTAVMEYLGEKSIFSICEDDEGLSLTMTDRLEDYVRSRAIKVCLGRHGLFR